MTVRHASIGDLAEVLSFAKEYEFDPYRDYLVFSEEQRRAVLDAEIEATLLHPDSRVYLHETAEGRAAVVARKLAWDSEFFGVPMARIEYLFADAPGAQRHAVRVSLDALRAEG